MQWDDAATACYKASVASKAFFQITFDFALTPSLCHPIVNTRLNVYCKIHGLYHDSVTYTLQMH
jgi:hypothetical protein